MQERIVCRKRVETFKQKICWRRKLKIYFSSFLSSCRIHTHRLSSSTPGDYTLPASQHPQRRRLVD